jgi:hypothetical protein
MKEQSGGETPYKIMSLIQLTEGSLELKDTTNNAPTPFKQVCIYLT